MAATLLTVAFLHWLILLTPGANVLLVSQLAAAGDRKAACFAALGVTCVAAAWSMLAMLGVESVFAAHPRLRLALQVAGGLYLGYVAVRLWRSGGGTSARFDTAMSATAAFRTGVITNLMNPKSALFFGSVFATTLPAQPATGLVAAVVALVFVNALVWHLVLAFAFSLARVQRAYALQRKALNRVAGALIGLFGLRMVAVAAADAR